MLQFRKNAMGNLMLNWYLLRGLPNDSIDPQHRVRTSGSSDGEWHVYSGTEGAVQVDGRVLSISAMAGSEAASVTIAGETIDMPPNMGVALEPGGSLDSPSVTFTDTVTYVIEVVR